MFGQTAMLNCKRRQFPVNLSPDGRFSKQVYIVIKMNHTITSDFSASSTYSTPLCPTKPSPFC